MLNLCVMSISAPLPTEISLTLPDGAVRRFSAPITGAEIAATIGRRLAADALAVKGDGKVCDLSFPLTADSQIEIITRDHPDAMELIRHDASHVMAEAVQALYPGVQVTIGPAIANGFYYDFAREQPFTPDDLEKIETKMREIIAANRPFVREEWPRDQAIAFFEARGEAYKAELIRDLPEGEAISVYRQGEWLDLCRGPHLPSTGRVGNGFKLTKVAGAYWRGDHRNAMLQRIYGTAWRDEKELKAYLLQLEEAEKRDHRRLGRELDLFHLQEEATGSVFWHPKGWALWRTLENYIRTRIADAGYVEVKTPQLIDRSLWEASGHWEKFRENMFTATADEDKILALKPMNCPGHVQIFRQGLKSYRDLPLRMAEFGACHRNEPSGSMHGIMRVRAFTQDDAHIFCTEEQITSESVAFCSLLLSVYKDLGFENVSVKFSDRPPVRAGADDVWDRAEAALKAAVEAAGLPYVLNPGEGAFYGPKLEFVLRDAIGRDWQCGTLQVDFVLPERLDASFIGEDSQRHRPVMLHRAILGSLERFIGVLIEHYAGRLPMWLAPIQVAVATITNDAEGYAREVVALLKQAGLRAILDVRNEKINFKVREHSLQKIPVMVVVGKREAENRSVALRRLGGKDQEMLALDTAVTTLGNEAQGPLGSRAAEA
ncbi:threonine--tRNA ligase [Azospirillaceae bacterium]